MYVGETRSVVRYDGLRQRCALDCSPEFRKYETINVHNINYKLNPKNLQLFWISSQLQSQKHAAQLSRASLHPFPPPLRIQSISRSLYIKIVHLIPVTLASPTPCANITGTVFDSQSTSSSSGFSSPVFQAHGTILFSMNQHQTIKKVRGREWGGKD
jgi:hypothetical protein